MNRRILVLGNDEDPHIAAVCKQLEQHGAEHTVFEPTMLNNGDGMYTHVIENGSHQVLFEDAGSKSGMPDSVWFRLKPILIDIPSNKQAYLDTTFVKREWTQALDAFYHSHTETFWMNPREADLRVRNKPYQLRQADAFGFIIPKTIISNDSEEVAQFFDNKKAVIYKPLSWYFEPPDKVLFSKIITKAYVSENRQSLAMAPGIFQEYIDKNYELRITIVGTHIFAAKIKSQELETTKTDWRLAPVNSQFETVTLEPHFAVKLLQLHKYFRLVYGAYDFIVNTEGQPVFLEVNPVGQWMWLEDALGMNISGSIAEMLLTGNQL